MQLKAGLLRRGGQLRFQRRKTIREHSAVCVDKNEHGPFRRLDAFIPCERNACMFLPKQSEGEKLMPTKYKFRCGFITPVVYEKNLKLRIPFQLAKRLQASFE